jgi:O-antigen/teichoic acid export membrane protein
MTAVGAGATTARGIAGSFSALMAGELVNKALRFAAAAVLARGLSPAEFGLFNVGIAAGGILVIATTMGLPEVAGRAVAVAPERAARLAVSVAAARVVATLLIGAVGLGLLELLWPGHFAFGAAIVLMAAAMGATADWVGRALERMRIVGAGAAGGGVVALAGAAVVAAASGSAAAGLVAFVVAELTADAIYWLALRGRGRPRGLALRSELRPLLATSWPVALSSLAIYSYYANLDTIVIAATRTEAEAGVYSAAYRIYLAANIVGIFAAYATFPRISRTAGLDGAEALVGWLRRTLEPLVAYGLAAVGLALVLGDAVLELSFGPRFGAAADTFVLLCVSTAWYCVGYPLGYNLVAVQRNRRFLAGATTGAATALGLDLLLIPQVGMIGAGVATTASIILATLVWVGPRGLGSAAGRPIALALVAGTSLAVAGLLVDPLRVPVGIGLAAASAGFLVRLVVRARAHEEPS